MTKKRTSLNSTSLTPKPLASSVYVHVPEAPSPHKRSIAVMSLFPFRPCERSPAERREQRRPATRSTLEVAKLQYGPTTPLRYLCTVVERSGSSNQRIGAPGLEPVTSSSLTGQRLEQRTDCRPELLLDLNGDGVLKPVRCLSTCLHRSKDADREFPVRVYRSPPPVPSQHGRSDPGDPVQLSRPRSTGGPRL